MKEIKAFIHRNRISDVVHALKQAGHKYIGLSLVKWRATSVFTRFDFQTA